MMLPSTARPEDLDFTIERHPYALATSEQLRQLTAKRSLDVAVGSAQDSPLGQPFALHGDFRHGYGLTFTPGMKGYETADGWDASAPGKIGTWPLHAALESIANDVSYRGWWYYDFATGYLYLFRGRYAVKYAPDDSGSDWSILEYHVFGTTGEVVAGQPALYKGKVYVPLATAATGVALRWHELTTIATPVTETQTVVISGTPTSGTYTLSFNDGLNTWTTTALAFNADQAAVQAALRLLPGLAKVTVVTTGSTPNFTHTITFTAAPGALSAASAPQLTSTDGTSGGTHGIAHATTVAGTTDTWTRGPSSHEATGFHVWNKSTVGPVLVLFSTSTVSMATTTPTTGANWSTAQQVDDTSYNITGLAVLGRLLFVTKTNGLFSFDESGIVVNELPSISSVVDAANGIGVKVHNSYLYMPHKLGLIRWRPGAPWQLVGAEEDDELDGERSTGWGQVAAMAPYGKYGYIGIADAWNSIGAVASLQQLRNGERGPITPQMHHQLLPVEDLAVAQLKQQSIPAAAPATWSDDAAVGTLAWTDPGNASADDGAYAEAGGAAGQTHYLKGLGLNLTVPSNATIIGITARVTRAKGVQNVTGAATLPGTGANFASVGTNPWTNPSNITADDDTYATNATEGVSQGLRASSLGLAIPATAQIIGIQLDVARKASSLAGLGTTYRSSNTVTVGGSGSAITISKPAGVIQGDVMLAYVYDSNGRSITAPDGWALVTTSILAAAPDGKVIAYWKVAGASEPASWAWGYSGVSNPTGACIAFRGCDQIAPVTDSPTASSNAALNHTIPSVLTPPADGMYVGMWQGGTFTAPGSMTQRQSANAFLLATEQLVGSGATGTRTATTASGTYAIMIGIVLKPAPGAQDSTVQLIGASGAVIGTNKAVATAWPTGEATVSYGGPADTWGATLTAADSADVDFGAIVSAYVSTGTGSVDWMKITLTYQYGDVVDAVVKLVKAGSVVGNNLADTGTQYPSAQAVATYGSSTNLWGTSWTAAEVSAATFGFVLSSTITTVGYARVQFVTIEIAATVPGAANPASYLVVCQVSADGLTASPVAYKLPRSGLTVSNDPQIARYVTLGATFATGRVYGPTRATVKRYMSVEGWADLEAAVPDGQTPGVRIEAQIEDSGVWVPLVDYDGGAALQESGPFELYFPDDVAAGRWVQLRAVVDAAGDGEVGVSVTLRDLTLRGYVLSETLDESHAVLVLGPAQQMDSGASNTRGTLTMIDELNGYIAPPDTGGRMVVEVHDPVLRRDLVAIVTGLGLSEFQFNGEAESVMVAVVKYQRVRGPKRGRA